MPDRDRFGGSERDYRPATDGFSRVLGSDFGFPTETAGPTRPPGQPISGRHIGYGGMGRQPIYTGFGGEGSRIMGYEDPAMDSGSYLASRYGGGLDDAAGMNDGARGMIEDAGFEVAQYTDDDKVIKRKLWPIAVNKFPPGTPDPIIKQEWERLQEEYWRMKDQQGYRPGVT